MTGWQLTLPQLSLSWALPNLQELTVSRYATSWLESIELPMLSLLELRNTVFNGLNLASFSSSLVKLELHCVDWSQRDSNPH